MKKKTLSSREKRQQHYRKYIQKKLTFREVFVKKLAALLCIAVLVGLVGTEIAIYYYRDKASMSSDYIRENVAAQLHRVYYYAYYNAEGEKDPQKSFVQWKNRLHMSLCLNMRICSSDCVVAVYDADTRQLYADYSEAAFILLKKGEDMIYSEVYEAPAEPWKEIYERLEQEQSSRGGIDIKMDEVYIKDGFFQPGKVQIVEQDPSTGEILDVRAVWDMTPDQTEGYSHIVFSEDGWKMSLRPIICGLNAEDPIWKDFENFMTEREKDIWNHSASSGILKYPPAGVLDANVETVDVYNEHMVTVVTLTRADLFEEYGRESVLIYIGMFGAVVLFAWTWSYRAYLLHQTQYQMDQYRRETANAMAHDLKSPLTAISGYAENLRDDLHSEKREYYAEAILKNVQGMDRMIVNILELAKVENTGYQLHKTEVDLLVLTEEIKRKQELLIEDKNLAVQVDGSASIQADPEWMLQALENLIGNAVIYSPPDTSIFIRLTEECYEIRNVAAGDFEVPVKDLWKPFVKGNDSRSGSQGTGIGLTIVKNIVEAHGFTLELELEEDEFVASVLFS